MLTPDVATFIEGKVMMLVATRDATHRPMIGRGSGARYDGTSGLVTVLVSASQWPDAVAHAGEGLPIATTYVRARDYRAFQIKGVITDVREADAAESERGVRYVREQLDVMMGLGVTRLQLSSTLSDRDLMAITFRPLDVFQQTPGPGAGQRFTSQVDA